MLDSATYQQILAEGHEAGRAEGREAGRAETLRRKLCRLVEHRLGRLPSSLVEALEGLELVVLDELFDRALESESTRALEALLDELRR